MAHDLLQDGRPTEAVKVLRKRAGLRRGEARQAASVLAAGGVLPEWPMPGEPDLPVRIARLKSAGRRKEAVFIARIERELNEQDAETFVDAI